MSSDSLNLGGYTLTFKGTGTFTSGIIYNGTLQGRASASVASFNGTKIDCLVDIVCGYIRLSGSTFEQDAIFEDLGFATGAGSGGCTFNGDVTIIHGGNGTYFSMGLTSGDTFNGNLFVINFSDHEINLASSGTTYYNGNIELTSTGNGGIYFGGTSGSSQLASGKTISIGSGGFTNDYLTLQRFTQYGSTSQTLSLSSTGNINLISCIWNANLTISAPGIFIKNNTFNGNTILTKTGSANNHSDGGNIFNGTATIENNATTGRIRLATNNPDSFNANATFNSTGQDLQVAYSGDNLFGGNITINSNKVVFNTSNGRVIMTGATSQTLNGSTFNFSFRKLTINKSNNNVTANTTVSVDDSLIFTNGKLITTSSNLLTMKVNSIALSASENSFVSGPMKKVGSTSFVFPVGKSSYYRPIEMTTLSSGTDAFTAEYFNSPQSLGYNRDASIKLIDNCNYWSLTRNNGSATPNVKLYWASSSCGIMDSLTSKVVNWNGSTWKDLGNGGITGNIYSGNIVNNTSVNTYGYFTIGYNTCLMSAYTVSDGDTAKVRTLNGTPNYTYLWSVGGTDSTKLGLSAGVNYTVTVTDGSGCSSSANYYKIFSKITGTPITSEANNSYYSTWGDYDDDGDLDLFHSLFYAAPNNTNGNNFLFQNGCDGNLIKVNAIPGELVSDGLTGNNSRWMDLDNDGDLDLYVGPNIIYENQGNGSFIKLSIDKKINTLPSYSPGIRDVSFVDYDNDGELDAYTGRHEIYQGDGSGNFNELSESSLSVINTSTTRGDAVSWADYDNDGYMDVFIANSYTGGANYLLKNDGDGTFTNITSVTNLTAAQGSYGCAWGDIDNDLDLDIWITNNATGDRLFINNGSGSFTQNTTSDIVTNTYTNQGGAAWADYDNDGDLDLFVPTFNKNFLFNNNGSGSFTKDVLEIVSMDASVESFGASWVDYDNDGDLDLFVPTAFGNPNDLFYTNNLDGATGHNWIKLNCTGVSSNKMAIGARVYIKANINGTLKWQMREINGNTTRGGESGGISSSTIHFGLGNAATIDSLKIVWPASSTTQIFTNVDVNQTISIIENINSITEEVPCIANLPIANPGYVTGKIYYDTNNNCVYNPGVDYPIANKLVQAEAGIYYTLTNDSGDYVLELPAGNYDIATNMVPDNWVLSSCQTDSLIPATVVAADTLQNIDFSSENKIIPCYGWYDISITSTGLVQGPCDPPLSLISPCPGFPHQYCFTVVSNSFLPSAAGTIFNIELANGFIFNSVLSSNPSPVSGNWIIGTQSGNILPCTLVNPLGPGSTAFICIEVTPNIGVVAPFKTRFDFQNPGGPPTNLVVNGDFETCDNTGVTSQYTYTTSTGVSSPGNYYVDESPIDIYNPMWSSTTIAHGGDCFLFADGNNSLVVWEQIIPVNINTQYDFGFCVTDILNPIYGPGEIPYVEIFINNAPQYILTGLPNWWNCSNPPTWCSDFSTSATLRLQSVSGNGTLGNDFGIDDIFFQESYGGNASIIELVACACDPNDKLVTPQGCGENGNVKKDEKLTYTVSIRPTTYC